MQKSSANISSINPAMKRACVKHKMSELCFFNTHMHVIAEQWDLLCENGLPMARRSTASPTAGRVLWR